MSTADKWKLVIGYKSTVQHETADSKPQYWVCSFSLKTDQKNSVNFWNLNPALKPTYWKPTDY